MTRKWRPSLWLVLGGALAGTLALSLAGIVALRYLGPEIGFRHAAILLAAIIGLLTAVLWLMLLRVLLRPVAALAAYAAAMRAPGREAVAPPSHFGTRELHDMGMSVIDMAATLSNRETTVRSFTNHVTHELRTPISTLRAATELLEDSAELSPADRHLVAQIRGAGQQLDRQMEALRQMAAAREADYRGRTALCAVIERLAPRHPGLRIVPEGERAVLPLTMEGAEIVFSHLFGNATGHGAKTVSVETRSKAGLLVVVRDDGRGVSAGNRERIFEPFFTTRRESGGTGMGLHIVASLLRAHGGRISLEPAAAGSGAAFRIEFPQT
ncbi:sensor histidine kinase [Stappia sp.]|uniref:sensor histidine kinase n=1 Tax=Stappia sp. TaxID=1870903 RepID=UPI003D0FDAF9